MAAQQPAAPGRDSELQGNGDDFVTAQIDESAPGAVAFLTAPAPARANLARLRERLGIAAGAPVTRSTANGSVLTLARVDLDRLPAQVRTKLANVNPDDRSAAMHELVWACIRAGLPSDRTLAVVRAYPPAVEKFGHRLDDEVLRSLISVHDKRLRPDRAPVVDGQDASDEQAAPPRRLVLTPASTIRPKPTVWIWETTPEGGTVDDRQGRFPVGSLVIAAGRAGLGKSQFAAWMTAHITRGTLPGCLFLKPRAVIYAASEDSWAMTIVPRLIAAGADLELVFRVDVTDDEDIHARLTVPVDTARLADAVREYGVAMMVLDPLLSMIDATVNDYRAREVRQALEPLVAMADSTGCLLLGLAHFTKATGNDPLTLISGSGAFGQLIRAGIGFARDEESDDESFVLSQIKNNLGRENLPSLQYVIQPAAVDTPDGTAHVSRFHFTGEVSDRSVRDLLRGLDDEHTDRDEAERWLRGYLTDEGGEAEAGDVLKAGRKIGFSERTLQRVRKRAGIKTGRNGFGGGWIWTLEAQDATQGAQDATPERVAPMAPSLAPTSTADTWLVSGRPVATLQSTPPAAPRAHSQPPKQGCPCGRSFEDHGARDWKLCPFCELPFHRYGAGGLAGCPHCAATNNGPGRTVDPAEAADIRARYAAALDHLSELSARDSDPRDAA
jgi:hypothetical protein